MNYTEDTLVQQTTADYLEQQLGWKSVYAYNNEDFWPDSRAARGAARRLNERRCNLRSKTQQIGAGARSSLMGIHADMLIFAKELKVWLNEYMDGLDK